MTSAGCQWDSWLFIPCLCFYSKQGPPEDSTNISCLDYGPERSSSSITSGGIEFGNSDSGYTMPN